MQKDEGNTESARKVVSLSHSRMNAYGQVELWQSELALIHSWENGGAITELQGLPSAQGTELSLLVSSPINQNLPIT